MDEKPGAFEMFGYDFMIDEQLNPWILEINKSPTLESSTVISKFISNFRKSLLDCANQSKKI